MWGIKSIYLFDFSSKDENGNSSNSGTKVVFSCNQWKIIQDQFITKFSR